MRIAYIVHDLADPAVARRVRMLRAGGAEVRLLGFCRRDAAPTLVAGIAATHLGHTADQKLGQRMLAVLNRLARFGPVSRAIAEADVVMARNLECLALAVRGAAGKRIVYECLDIHRLLLGSGLAARAVQAIERRFMRDVALILTSSPRFTREYFHGRQGYAAPVALVENRLLTLDGPPAPVQPLPAGPPWVIGWFGMIRCRRSYEILKRIAGAGAGRVRILIAGIVSQAVLPELISETAANPHIDYLGPYHAEDLGRLYGSLHFAWAIDYYEEGLNSRWLLPNRLYEATSFGAVPIALEDVETGAWLRRHDAGIVLSDPAAALPGLLETMDAEQLGTLRAKIAAIPRNAIQAGPADCVELVRTIGG